MNNILKIILILIGAMNIGFGLGVLFAYQDYITRTDALIVLMLSFILGIFILSWIFIRPLIKKNNEKDKSKKENSNGDSGEGI
ncbi:MAG TPA: hypothetical protein PKU93_03525 [Candidatus Pacearchaeota archaeon]|nr:hypothetical protein [Candidatus Pacearchaeota archaeon]